MQSSLIETSDNRVIHAENTTSFLVIVHMQSMKVVIETLWRAITKNQNMGKLYFWLLKVTQTEDTGKTQLS